jgi:hypothetical protein
MRGKATKYAKISSAEFENRSLVDFHRENARKSCKIAENTRKSRRQNLKIDHWSILKKETRGKAVKYAKISSAELENRSLVDFERENARKSYKIRENLVARV